MSNKLLKLKMHFFKLSTHFPKKSIKEIIQIIDNIKNSLYELAIFSKDNIKRYSLLRKFNNSIKKTILFIGDRPSTANAEIDDRTVKRLIKFSRCKYKELRLVNLNPICGAKEPIEDLINILYIKYSISLSDEIVCMWGIKVGKVPGWLNDILKEKKLYCFGINRDKYNTPKMINRLSNEELVLKEFKF